MDIIRAGELGERLPLTREVTTFGRDAASVDVAVLHESCSRVHAALSVDASSGKLYICDQGSANGSFLNKARLPVGKWVLLSDGSSFRFGESSRLYVVIEPSGGASAAIVNSAAESSAVSPQPRCIADVRARAARRRGGSRSSLRLFYRRGGGHCCGKQQQQGDSTLWRG